LGRSQLGKASPELRIDARRNQQRILRAAARLLAADPATSVQQIADEAEVARPTVYRRYPTREALIDAILDEAIAEFDATMADVAKHSSTAAEAIEQLIRSLAQIGTDYPILLSGPHAAHQPGTDDAGSASRRRMAGLVDQFDAQIARGQHDHSIRTDLAPEIVRHVLFGALALALQLRQQQPFGTPLSSGEVGEQVASLLMDGLRRRTDVAPSRRRPST
jgi:AcrR family transcriptional regulator